MRKGTMLSVVAGLSLAILAGCSGGTNSKQASSSNDIKVWVQFSDETNEGKAWQKVVDNFNQSGKSKYKVVTEYIPRSGMVEDMKTRLMLLLRLIVFQMLLPLMDQIRQLMQNLK